MNLTLILCKVQSSLDKIFRITGEVGGLSAAGDPLPQDEEEEEVASGEAQSQFPLRISDATVNVGRLVKDVVAENGGRKEGRALFTEKSDLEFAACSTGFSVSA